MHAPCTQSYCAQSVRQTQTRPDQTRPDQTRPDQTRPDQTPPPAASLTSTLSTRYSLSMALWHGMAYCTVTVRTAALYCTILPQAYNVFGWVSQGTWIFLQGMAVWVVHHGPPGTSDAPVSLLNPTTGLIAAAHPPETALPASHVARRTARHWKSGRPVGPVTKRVVSRAGSSIG
jgi:hypothetical protein